MKRFLTFILSCSFAFLSLSQEALAAAPLNGIAAVVNGSVITKADVNNEVIAQRQSLIRNFGNNPTLLKEKVEQLRREALDALINRELILGAFEGLGGEIKPEFVENQINEIIRKSYDNNREKFIADLSRAGLSLKEFRALQMKKLIAQYMRGQQGQKVDLPTYQEIMAYYQKHLEDFKDDDLIKLRTLSISKFSGGASTSIEDQKNLAQDLHGQLLRGANFAKLAVAHSSDSAATKGGDRGWVTRSDISKEMANVAFKVKSGGISEIIETSGTFTILWVEARKGGTVSSLEEVRDTIENRVKAAKGIEIEKKWLDRLRRNAVIKEFK